MGRNVSNVLDLKTQMSEEESIEAPFLSSVLSLVSFDATKDWSWTMARPRTMRRMFLVLIVFLFLVLLVFIVLAFCC